MTINDYIINHKEHCYCEAVIYPNGDIEDAHPSHTYKLVEITGKEMDEINEMMPLNAGPVYWLVDYTGCVSVWYEFGLLPENVTDMQRESIEKLINNGILSPDFHAEQNFELKKCGINKIEQNTDLSDNFKQNILNDFDR